MQDPDAYDEEICDAIAALQPSELLCSAILDRKPEAFATQELVLQLNKRNGRHWRTEYKRIDMVREAAPIVEPHPEARLAAAYEVKGLHLSEFSRRDIEDSHNGALKKEREHYRGGGLFADLQELPGKIGKAAQGVAVGGLYFIYEVQPPQRQSKYRFHPGECKPADAVDIVRRVLSSAHFVAEESSKSAVLCKTTITLHALLFRSPVRNERGETG